MTAKPVIPRARARDDVEAALDHYLNEAGADTAIAFIDALEEAYGRIGIFPAAGSPRWAHDLNLPGLRSIRLTGFPWLIFYIEKSDHVDVWRILHGHRDIPAWMTGAED